MKKKLQVFVSSTYTDLIEERQKAVEAILDAGHIPAGMELFKAGKSQMETIKKWIDESDVYCLILGGRYGSVEEKSKLSYTQLEYQYAISKGKPSFAIILDVSMLHKKKSQNPTGVYFETGENEKKYKEFKEEVGKKIYRVAKNTSDIATCIHLQLNEILSTQSEELAGWIRGIKGVDKEPVRVTQKAAENMEISEIDITLENKKGKLMEVDEKIRKSPQDAQLYMERAELLVSMDRNNLQKAIPDYLYAIFLEPEFSEAYYSLIQKLTIGKDYSRALRFAEEACRLFPNEGNAYGCRAYVKHSKKLYQESIDDCNRAISLQSNRWFYNTRGRCYLGLNQLYTALEDFIMANRLDPEYIHAIKNVKLVVEKIGISNVIQSALDEKKNENFEKSKLYLESVMLADPNNEKGLQEYGGLYYDLKKYPEALEYWKKALDVNRSCKNYYLCAVAYRCLNDHSLAIEFCQSALEYPDDGYYKKAYEMLEM